MKRLFISLAILAGISLSSCNDSFLEKTPVTDLTENNAFNSYDNFKAFMWPCYEMFTNNTIRTSLQGFGQDGQYKGDMAAGYFQQKYESGYNEFAYQTVVQTCALPILMAGILNHLSAVSISCFHTLIILV